jgi:hypothetical protein
MLTDCPHCYKKMHDEADFCPHCREHVPNASEISSSSIEVEGILKYLIISAAIFFGLGMALDYLSWWSDWELVPGIVVALGLAFGLMWVLNAPERASARRQAKSDREEAPLLPLRKQRFQHECNHPRNDPDWGELSDERREKLTAQWEMELAEIERKIDQYPRPSLY